MGAHLVGDVLLLGFRVFSPLVALQSLAEQPPVVDPGALVAGICEGGLLHQIQFLPNG